MDGSASGGCSRRRQHAVAGAMGRCESRSARDVCAAFCLSAGQRCRLRSLRYLGTARKTDGSPAAEWIGSPSNQTSSGRRDTKFASSRRHPSLSIERAHVYQSPLERSQDRRRARLPVRRRGRGRRPRSCSPSSSAGRTWYPRGVAGADENAIGARPAGRQTSRRAGHVARPGRGARGRTAAGAPRC
jgi:hypothetical protein